jgi:type IV pilus assembly protein PilX
MKPIKNKFITKQSGAVLIVSMLMLLVVTMLGITSMSPTVMEEKMAGNNRQKQLAFQAAGAGLRTAEVWLNANITNVANFVTTFTAGAPAELYWLRRPSPGDALKPLTILNIYDSNQWAVGNSIQIAQALVPNQPRPRYIIEYMGQDGEPPLDPSEPDVRRYAFRVTAIGMGTDQVTSHVAQSTFRMPLF